MIIFGTLQLANGIKRADGGRTPLIDLFSAMKSGF